MTRIERRVVASSPLHETTPRRIAREFRDRLAAGARLISVGETRDDPESLLSRGYTPRFRVDLFDTRYYLSGLRQNDDLRFFVGYVVRDGATRPGRRIHARLFYKDVSLVWRVASHFVRTASENWIGKGSLQPVREDGEVRYYSDEATTDLPLEVQTAFEDACRRSGRIPRNEIAVRLVLRRGGEQRVAPYADFTAPRERAQSDRRNLVNGGRPIARFERPDDPGSLRFVRGFAPDFRDGIVEAGESASRLYGGRLRRFRILSQNRQVQSLFFGGPRHAWIGSCQATTTDLSSFGVRTVDVSVPEALLLPGFEYHYLDDLEDPPVWVSQIPEGFAGAASEVDPSRADASAWLERTPVIRAFRREVLGAACRSPTSSRSPANRPARSGRRAGPPSPPRAGRGMW